MDMHNENYWKQIVHNEQAKRLGISPEELRIKKARLNIIWNYSGGMEAARIRLKFAEEFIKKHL